MCGISGIVGQKYDYAAQVGRMVLAQSHRGPDAHAVFSENQISLGHNRLSIIDLNESANQPFHSACGRYVMVFNGEVYNYQELKARLFGYNFRTSSDTEVLVALFAKYGPPMLEWLNGMFAFAIWDKEERQLFCSRDRFGVKPFYYAVQDDCFFFASEVKSIHVAGVEKQINRSVLSDYITNGSFGMPDESFWKGVQQLPGGFTLTYTLSTNRVEIKPYYDFVNRVQEIEPLQSEERLRDTYYPLLYDAVSLRFVADVPVGFNLSGGLDSSLLLAFVNATNPEMGEQIEAFTFYTGDPNYDELPWVELLLEQEKNPLNRVKLTVDELPMLAEQVAIFQDEPFGGFPTIAYSKIFHHAREKGIKVLLDGQGMDEAWAGYDYYRSLSTQSLVQGTKSPLTRPAVFEADFLGTSHSAAYPKPFESELLNLQYRDIFYTKIPRALRFNDRVSMQHSVELREPFLDYRLVEFAFAQEEKWKIHDHTGKWFLRRFAEKTVPKQLSLAPKRPLQTPQREWLRGELKDWADAHIQQLAQRDFVCSRELFKEWESYQKGNSDNSFYVWQWINLNIILNTNK